MSDTPHASLPITRKPLTPLAGDGCVRVVDPPEVAITLTPDAAEISGLRLIAEADAHNPNLKIAGLRVIEARAQLGIAQSGRYPQMQQASADSLYLDRNQSGGRNPQDSSFWQHSAGFELPDANTDNRSGARRNKCVIGRKRHDLH